MIVDAASQGIINGSFIIFICVQFLSSLLLGRAWCGWACPATYQCFAPHHFPLTERLFSGPLPSLMERAMGCRPTRPRSKTAISYASPQEDEYALTFLGAGSPYLGLMFPSHRADFLRYRDLDAFSESERHVWKDRFLFFLKKITLRNPDKQLVLKSPAHSFRIKTLLELFPDARFVHIMRDPYAVFPSTLQTFKASFRYGSLETAAEPDWEDWVFEMGLSLYDTLEQTRKLIPPGHFHETRYEDLVKDPVGMMCKLYTRLDLDDFETELRPGLETFLTRVSQHTNNQYHLPAELRDVIGRRWKPILERYDRIQPGG